MGEEDADADEAEVVAVSAVLPPPRSGTGDRMLTNMGEKNEGEATMEITAGADHLTVAIVLRGEEGDEEDKEDKYQTTTTVMGDPLLIMVPTHFPHLRPRRTLRTRRHLSLLRHRTHSLRHPLLHHLCLRLL